MAIIDTRPFSRDQATGAVKQWYHYDDETDEIIIEDVLDLETIGNYNRERAKVNTGRFKDGMNWIGSIPMPVYLRLQKRRVFEDQKEFRKWWMSEESAPFRGRDMRV